MKPTLKYRALLVAASSLLAAHAANAANSLYAAGDLMLTFQQVGGGNTVYVDLGNSATLYRGTAAGADVATNIDFININSTLVSAFGSGWASDPSIYAGLAGVNSTSSTSSTLVNGDPPRTLYVSAPRADVGTLGQANSVTPTVASNTLMTTAASGIQTQNNVFGTLPSDTLQAVVTTDVSKIRTQQPITTFQGNNYQGTAFGTFDGGIQQQGAAGSFGSFGTAGTVEFALDLYRILGKNTVPGQVAGDLRSGTYEGTITVSTGGGVSFSSLTAVPEPASVMFTCLLTLGGLTMRNRRRA